MLIVSNYSRQYNKQFIYCFNVGVLQVSHFLVSNYTLNEFSNHKSSQLERNFLCLQQNSTSQWKCWMKKHVKISKQSHFPTHTQPHFSLQTFLWDIFSSSHQFIDFSGSRLLFHSKECFNLLCNHVAVLKLFHTEKIN